MSFRAAVGRISALAQAHREGLQALDARDRAKIKVPDARRLRGSVNLDRDLQATRPNDPRWDYAIGQRRAGGDYVYWVEVHPADSGNVGEVLRKLAWLRTWLAGAGRSLGELPKEFCWVASGRVDITPNSPQARRLAQSGLRLSRRVVIG